MRLPKLLAAERKYGSRNDRSPIRENQACSSGAVPARITNGGPTVKSRALRSQRTGFASPGGLLSPAIETGSIDAAASKSAGWARMLNRYVNHRETPCA